MPGLTRAIGEGTIFRTATATPRTSGSTGRTASVYQETDCSDVSPSVSWPERWGQGRESLLMQETAMAHVGHWNFTPAHLDGCRPKLVGTDRPMSVVR